MSNMRQLGLALVQYSQDSDNTPPPAAIADGHGWREDVYPYVKSVGVYQCPSDATGGSHESSENLSKSYAANISRLGNVKLSDPAKTVIAMDTRGFGGEDWDMTAPAFLPSAGRELYTHKP